ncbi:MAG: hypothetical protein U5R06_19220 [candidate division KSB1 bacterium]|nr:hypothetical protein [candidate division KSB1 bacterium]
MKDWIRYGGGLLFGAGLGYLYFRLVGCQTGTCPLQSSPILNIALGAVIGLILVDEVWKAVEQRRER